MPESLHGIAIALICIVGLATAIYLGREATAYDDREEGL